MVEEMAGLQLIANSNDGIREGNIEASGRFRVPAQMRLKVFRYSGGMGSFRAGIK